jgi:hypothetical protein
MPAETGVTDPKININHALTSSHALKGGDFSSESLTFQADT